MARRDIPELRPASEVKYLHEHVAEIRDDPEVADAFALHNASRPDFTVESFQDAVLIDKFPCRLTIGTLALLRCAQARVLGYGDTGPGEYATPYDIALGVFLMSDDHRSHACSVVDDVDELKEAVQKFSKRLRFNAASPQLCEFLRRHGEAINPPDLDVQDADDVAIITGDDRVPADDIEDHWKAPDNQWVDDVDLFAYEYKWRFHFILWVLPLACVTKLREAITARRTGKPRRPSQNVTGIALLQTIERRSDEIRETQGLTDGR